MAGKLGFKRTAIVAAAAAVVFGGGGTLYAFAAGEATISIEDIDCLRGNARATVTVKTSGERDGNSFIRWETTGSGAASGRSDWFDSEEQSFEVRLNPGANLTVTIESPDAGTLASADFESLCSDPSEPSQPGARKSTINILKVDCRGVGETTARVTVTTTGQRFDGATIQWSTSGGFGFVGGVAGPWSDSDEQSFDVETNDSDHKLEVRINNSLNHGVASDSLTPMCG